MNSDSNDVFSANRSLFASRFPELASLIGLDSIERANLLLDSVPAKYAIHDTRSPFPTLSADGIFIHSRYDPKRDAERTIEDVQAFRKTGCVFAGLGLAYLPELYAQKYPLAPIILVEPDVFLFALCLKVRPLTTLLSHENLIIVVGASAREALNLLEKLDMCEIPVHATPAITVANPLWLSEFEAIRKRSREKKEINANTLKRFGDLWLKNMCKNLKEMRDRDGIGLFADTFRDIPVLILAAGPSLDRILGDLVTLRKQCLIIAVDTAVRACVRAGVEPDFIMLVDPQYWNYRHLDGIACNKSILITESAAWPAVFRFKCRAIHLCSSLFPLGKFLETRTRIKGELGAGGSVSTTAWDFARHLGCRNIIMAGLDLGFPDKKTHFTGSIFEERTHVSSQRFAPAETAGYLALYGAGPYPVPDYRGTTVLTDKRLILYAWWFESRLATYPEQESATLTPEGVRIPGFSVITTGELTRGEEKRGHIDSLLTEILASRDERDTTEMKESFDNALAEMKRELKNICALSDKAINLCVKGLKTHQSSGISGIVTELNKIDTQILTNTAKEITSMVFPEMSKKNDEISIFLRSKMLYEHIITAAKKNLTALEKFY